ncbi:MAG TPA: DPP IV N-terminal domain-containing protein, partial [Candidatus Limnocylindrales bacterium]|nr:DPP IV N-terminal domain-containing protein [Candidatus Limnocylindrales bacterium]
MKRLGFFLLVITFAPALASAQELTIASIFAPNGITGRAPDTIQWSPDGRKVSYIVHEEQGEKADLYYIDVTTGKPAVLVASERIASMKPPKAAGSKDDREQDNRERYHVAGYHWSPDSQHLLFDANGLLWYYTLANGTAVALSPARDEASDPKFSPDGKLLSYVRRHNLYIAPIEGKKDRQLTTGDSEDLLNGEVDWVYREELDVRSNYFWSPQGKKIVFLQMDESKVPSYPITDFIPHHPTVYKEKYPKVGDPNPEVRL